MEQNKQNAAKENPFMCEVVRVSGEKIPNCFQCQKCSAGCPVAFAMDILPNQMLRHIHYGHRKEVLSSKTIWLCAYCYACSVRCPNNIDIAKIMDTLRNMSLRSGTEAGEKDIPIFHSLFLDGIKSKGRIHELGLLIRLKIKTKNFFKDALLGLKMFLKGRIKLLPSKHGEGKKMSELFNEYEKGVRR